MDEHDDRPMVPEEPVARQIGFAEHWLARAKQEVTAGRSARSALALLLAEAEAHHARERTLPASEGVLSRPSMTATLWGAGTLAVLLLAVSLIVPRGEMDRGYSSAPSVIRFNPVGSTLALIPAIAAAGEAATVAPPPHVSAAPPSAPRTGHRVSRPASPSTVRNQAQPAAAPVPVPVAPARVSDGDLIDLVLAAERSLRAERR